MMITIEIIISIREKPLFFGADFGCIIPGPLPYPIGSYEYAI
jgi:hypothetical protein